MKYDPELFINGVCNSKNLRRLLVAFALIGAVLCVIPLIPSARDAAYAFIDAHISRKGSRGTFESRFLSLLSLSLVGLAAFALLLCCLFSKAIARFVEEAKHEKFLSAAAVAAIALALAFIAVFSYQHGRQWLDSDNASEMILGKILADENTFVSSSWKYSTEIRLIYQTIFTMPLFKALGGLGDWALIRALNILLNNIVLVLSYAFMMCQLKVQRKWILWTALFLVMPVSTGYWNIVTFGGYYVFFIAQFFCCLGLFFRLCRTVGGGGAKPPVIAFCFFTLSSLLLGVQGVRALLCVQIPLFLTGVCHTGSNAAHKKRLPLVLGAYSLVVCLAGFLVNYALHFKYSFSSFENMLLDNLNVRFLPKLGECLASLAGFFGLHAGSSLLSARGFFSVVAIWGTGLLFFIAFKRSTTPVPTDDNAMKKQGVLQFFLLAALFNIFVFIIVDEGVTGKYFILFMVLYIPALATFFEELFKGKRRAKGHVKRVSIASAIALFVLGQSFLNIQDLALQDSNSKRDGYIDYLLEKKLNYGFALFWNANVTTELSNGRIEVAGLHTEALDPAHKNFRLHGWLNPVKVYDPAYREGEEAFLLLSRNEWTAAKTAGRPFALTEPDYADDDYIVFTYPSPAIVHAEAFDK